MSGISTAIEIQDRVSGSLNRITAALYNTTSAFDAVDNASDVAFNPSGIQAMTQEMYGYEQRIRQLESDLVKSNRQLEDMVEQTQRATQAANMLKKAFGLIGGVLGVSKILQTSDELVQTTSRVDMMNDGLQTTDELMNMVYRSAQNARGSFNDMADVVARFGNNVGIGENSVFKSSEEVVQFAELLQKQMTIAGASATEASAAMLQLSQGLGSGTLRGDELNSIFEQAPNLIRNIATYIEKNEKVAQHMADVVGVSYDEMATNAMGHIRDLAAEGQLSADIVKNAIFSATTDINEQFDSMPMTWGQVWQSMQNTALMSFQPVLNEINKLASSGTFQNIVSGITSALAKVANVALKVFNLVATLGGFIADNWSIIAPIVAGVVSIMGVYWAVTKGITIAQTAYNAVVGAFHALQTFVSIGWGMITGSTAAASAAQFVYNNALLSCPLTWIIMAIIALIAIIYAAVAVFNKFAKASVSATGIIAGVFSVLVAFIKNYVVLPIWNIFASLVNFIGNAFNDPVAAIKILFYDMVISVIDYVTSLASTIESVINKIPGVEVDMTSGLESFTKDLEAAQQKIKDESGWVEYVAKMEYSDYEDAFNKGYSFGEDLDAKISKLFSEEDDPYKDDETQALLDSINTNTTDIADSVSVTNENLKYLRDIAEQEVVNRFTTAEIKVDMTNNNNISSNMDIDGIVEQLTIGVQEAMESAAEGV